MFFLLRGEFDRGWLGLEEFVIPARVYDGSEDENGGFASD
jgi:hypothetical protein